MGEPILLFVGAEGLSEADRSWFREPTEKEMFDYNVLLGTLTMEKLAMDSTGRPYFLVAIEDDAPQDVREKARKNLRVVRLRE